MAWTEGLTLDDECMSILHQFEDEYQGRNIREALTMAIQIAEQICILDENRDLVPIRQLDWHLKVDPLTVLMAHWLRDLRTMKEANQLIGHLSPLYAEAKRRQDKKVAWLRTHPNGDRG
jgi:hypothetical protein